MVFREAELRVSHLMSAFAAVILVSLGFVAGWSFSQGFGWDRISGGVPVEETRSEQPPPARDPVLPDEDVEGADIEDLPRYPGSVRIEYIRQDQGELIWTEAEFLTAASLDEVREFYRDTFREQDWSVNDIEFRQQSWIFFVVKGEREVFVELSTRGDIVEIDLEQTEPNPEPPGKEQTTPEQTGAPSAQDFGGGYHDDFDDLDDYDDDFDD